MKYRRFFENNDHEGETWSFFIPIKGNKKALKLLMLWVESLPEDLEETYWFSHRKWTSEEIDILELDEDDSETTTYMCKHNVLEGKLVLPDLPLLEYFEDDEDKFYEAVGELLARGSIRDWMQDEEDEDEDEE